MRLNPGLLAILGRLGEQESIGQGYQDAASGGLDGIQSVTDRVQSHMASPFTNAAPGVAGAAGEAVRSVVNAPGAYLERANQTRQSANSKLLGVLGSPRPQRAGMNSGDALTAGLGLLLGKLTGAKDRDLAGGLNAFTGARTAALDRETEDRFAAHEDQRKIASIQHQLETDEAQADERRAARIQGSIDSVRESQARAKERAEDRQFQKDLWNEKNLDTRRERAWTSYNSANSPGEKRAAAARLGALDPANAPKPDQVAADIRDMARSAIDAYHKDVMSIWKSSWSIDETTAKQLADQRQSLIDQYGLDKKEVREAPTAQTLAKVRQEDTRKRFAESQKLAREKFAWTQDNAAKRLEVSWAMVSVARSNAQNAIANGNAQVAKMFIEGSQPEADKLASKYIESIKKIENIDLPKAQQALEEQIQKNSTAKRSSGVTDAVWESTMQEKLQPYQQKVQSLQTELGGWKNMLAEENAGRAEFGQAPMTVEEAFGAAKELRGNFSSETEGMTPGGAPLLVFNPEGVVRDRQPGESRSSTRTPRNRMSPRPAPKPQGKATATYIPGKK